MRVEGNSYVFNDAHEKELYLDLKQFILTWYKGKRNLKRLFKAMEWYCIERENNYFKGYVFDVQGTLSCWGTHNERDDEKCALYVDFMKNYCDDLMGDPMDRKDSLVSFAIASAYVTITKSMKEMGIVM